MRAAPITIVGGGIAGATIALLLARAGAGVVLLERRREIDGKCCGGCLAPRAIPVLRRLGLERLVRATAIGATRRWRLLDPRGRPLLEESLGDHEGLVVERTTLDAALRNEAQAAGARVRSDMSLEEVIASRPALIIGADGVGSGVARRFGMVASGGGWRGGVAGRGVAPGGSASIGAKETRTRRAARRFGVSWTLRDRAPPPASLPEGMISIHLAPEGYLGLIRAGRGLLVAALVERDRVRGTVKPLEVIRRWTRRSRSLGWLTEALDADRMLATGPLPWRPAWVARAAGAAVAARNATECGATAEREADRLRGEDSLGGSRLHGRPSPSAPPPAAPTAAPLPGVALVGDAAGYEEPFTGEGMTWALESAELLALEVLRAAAWDASAAERYQALHRRMFARRRLRLRALAGLGSAAARIEAAAMMLRAAGAIPKLPGAIVRSVVAA